MTKEQLVQLIEAYADAKATSNNYLISIIAQQLSESISSLFPEPEDFPKEATVKVSRAK